MSAATPPPRRTIVYVANADSHDISVLALDAASGALAEVERCAVGGTVMPLAASRDARVLYASIRSEPHRVASLRIDPASGGLTVIGSVPLPASMCWISSDRSGRFLLSASYGSSLVAVSPIGADGVAVAAHQVVATAANAHAVQTDQANRFAFATCLGGADATCTGPCLSGTGSACATACLDGVARAAAADDASVMMRESKGRASASPAPVPGFTTKAGNDEGCKDRRNAAPAGTVAQSARRATILGPGALASATRR